MDSRIYALDVFRALAILLVMLTHFEPQWFPMGNIGVSVFFSLSGYLVAKQLLNPEMSISKFLLRRLFKIYPPYVAAVLLQVVLMYVFGSALLGKYINSLPGLLLVTSMPKEWIGLGSGIFWSLHVEMVFYIVMALAVLLFGRGRYFFVILLLLCACLMIGKVLAIFGIVSASNSLSRFFIWGDGLLYGSIVAFFGNGSMRKNDFGPIYVILIICLFSVALLLPNKIALWLSISSIVSFFASLAILGVARYGADIGIPDFRIIRYVAKISYSLYLFHGAYMAFSVSLGGFRYAAVAGLITSLIAYYIVEVNSLKFERWIEKNPSRR